MKSCHSRCGHRALVQDYRDQRDAREALREQGDSMRMEDDEFDQTHPPVWFKQWLAHRQVPE